MTAPSAEYVPTYLRCEGGPNHGETMALNGGVVRPAEISVGFGGSVGCDGSYVEDVQRARLVWHRRPLSWDFPSTLRLWRLRVRLAYAVVRLLGGTPARDWKIDPRTDG